MDEDNEKNCMNIGIQMFQIERLLAAILFLRVTDISLVLLISPGEYRACGRRIRERRPPIFANFFPGTTIDYHSPRAAIARLSTRYGLLLHPVLFYALVHAFTRARRTRRELDTVVLDRFNDYRCT